MTRHVCNVLKISFIQLAKLKLIRGFDSKPALPIIYTIYPMLTVQSYIKSLAPFLITKLGQYPLIFGKLWMQKHNIIMNMSCDKLTFWSRHCQHLVSLPVAVNILVESYLSTSAHLRTSATMSLASYVENPTTSVTASAEPQKSKKLKPIKIPPTIPGVQPVYQGVSKLANSKGEKYIIPTKYILKPARIPKPKAELVDKTKLLDLAFIGTAPFQYLARQKDIKIFAVFMQDIENELNVILMKNIKYQLNKTAKTPTDPKTIIPEKYHEFLNVFLKETSNTLSSYLKYNHQICLLKSYKNYGNSPFSKMSEPKLQFVKKLLEKHLKKGFIEASSALYSSWIMLAAKSGGGIRFCVNYRRLNELTKKDVYLILLIEKTLA